MPPHLLLLPLALAEEPPRVSVPHVDDAAITVDGHLDEPAWAQATVITELVRWAPSAGGPPPGSTEVRLIADDRRLYLGFTVQDPEPQRLRAHVAPREDVDADDQIGFSLDPFLDRKSAYSFWVNPLGVQQDFRDSVTGDFNLAWDAVWSSKGRLTEDGYVVEVALPWKSLPYPRDEEQVWGVMLNRGVARDGTWYAWPKLDIEAANVIAQEAELVVRPPTDRLRLELLPTLTGHQTWTQGEPVHHEALDVVEPGLDLRWGPSPDLSIEATANPDFSQIEADPFLMDVNIRYALSLEERRPFFLAGYDTFTDPLETLYTRAIVDPLFGAKIAGRKGGARFGVLSAYDTAPEGSLVWDRETPGFSAGELADRHAQSTILRYKHDLSTDLQIGGIYAEKDVFDAERGLYGGLHASNRLGGADLTATFADRWLVQAEARGSWTGETGGETLGFGHEVQVDLERRGSPGWNGQWKIHDVSPDFRSETSYQDRVGYTGVTTKHSYKFEPTDLSSIAPAVELTYVWDREGGLGPEHFVGAELNGSPSQKFGGDLGGAHRRELWAGQMFPYLMGWSSLWGDVGWLGFSAQVLGGGTIDYGSAEAANQVVGSGALELRPLPRLQLEATYAHQSVWGAEQGDLRYQLNLTRLATRVQFTTPLGLRVIGQWRDDEGLLDGSALLTWLWSPGTAAYVGYSETRRQDQDFGVQERSVFAKVSGLIRL